MAVEDDASRVSNMERGRPSFQFWLNARAPPRAFLFALVTAQMPSTVRTARAPTDLKPNLIRVKKRDDERAHRREGGERVKEFQHLGTSDRVVGRPRTGCVARVFYCEHSHLQLVNAIFANICSIFIRLIHRAMEPGCVIPKRTGQTPVRSLPRKENGKARTSMDEKSVRKSHGHHIPPAKGMGE